MKSKGLECDFYIQIYNMIIFTSGSVTRKARYISLYICYVELTSLLRAASTCVAPTSLWCHWKHFLCTPLFFIPTSTAFSTQHFFNNNRKKALGKEKNKNCKVKETKKTCILFLNLHHNSCLYPRFMCLVGLGAGLGLRHSEMNVSPDTALQIEVTGRQPDR